MCRKSHRTLHRLKKTQSTRTNQIIKTTMPTTLIMEKETTTRRVEGEGQGRAGSVRHTKAEKSGDWARTRRVICTFSVAYTALLQEHTCDRLAQDAQSDNFPSPCIWHLPAVPSGLWRRVSGTGRPAEGRRRRGELYQDMQHCGEKERRPTLSRTGGRDWW